MNLLNTSAFNTKFVLQIIKRYELPYQKMGKTRRLKS